MSSVHGSGAAGRILESRPRGKGSPSVPRITAWFLGVVACVRAVGAEPALQRLYDGPAPGSEQWQLAESRSTSAEGVQTYANVRDPGFLVYPPRRPDAAGTGVILLPGGALRALVVDGDVRRVITGLNDMGVTVFLLKYRILQSEAGAQVGAPAVALRPPPQLTLHKANANPSPEDPALAQVLKFAIADAGRALDLVRHQAPRWGLEPGHVGMLGYSAGGGVAIGALLRSRPGTAPSFIATIYGPSLVDVDVPPDAPPLFIATETRHGPVTGGLLALAALWRDAGRPVELHMFDVNAFAMPSALWFGRFSEWLAAHGLLSGAVPPGSRRGVSAPVDAR